MAGYKIMIFSSCTVNELCHAVKHQLPIFSFTLMVVLMIHRESWARFSDLRLNVLFVCLFSVLLVAGTMPVPQFLCLVIIQLPCPLIALM